MVESENILIPDWPAANTVKAATTTRLGGVSREPYDSFNLATHVGDDEARVEKNRELLQQLLCLPARPRWLRQVHGNTVVNVAETAEEVEADASVAFDPGAICVVLTADCLPALFCDRQGTVVAAAHAGWRGLAAGVLEQTVSAMKCAPEEIMVWLGPAIGPGTFEVGDEVREVFVSQQPMASQAFAARDDKWLADIYMLARIRLQAAGVETCYGGDYCTYNEATRFYSYRRDGQTGRMASLIWLDSTN